LRKLIIDRFEGTYAICEDQEKKMFAISLNELPQGAKPGDVLQISGAGELSVDQEETQRRRKKMAGLQSKLFR
jgi:hypothetical protein